MTLINALLDTLTQTDEWSQMQQTPIIAEAERNLHEALKGIPAEQREEIEAAAAVYSLACERAALLFGIGLTDAIRAAGVHPAAYLQEWE